MDGKKLGVVFPLEVYNFIQDLTKKMQSVPAKQIGQDGQFHSIINPITGKPIPLSQTGKVEEFIHMSIVQSMATIIMTDPNDATFMTERMKLQKIMDVYGQFIQKSLGGHDVKAKKA